MPAAEDRCVASKLRAPCRASLIALAAGSSPAAARATTATRRPPAWRPAATYLKALEAAPDAVRLGGETRDQRLPGRATRRRATSPTWAQSHGPGGHRAQRAAREGTPAATQTRAPRLPRRRGPGGGLARRAASTPTWCGGSRPAARYPRPAARARSSRRSSGAYADGHTRRGRSERG